MKPLGLARTVIGLAALAAIGGCGPSQDLPELGLVTGTVTLDGTPQPGLQVRFEPQAAALSVGVTDASGRYELRYTNEVKGAAVGKHTVRIEAFEDADAAGQGAAVVIPPRYNLDSTLTADVKAGENTINFELTSNPG